MELILTKIDYMIFIIYLILIIGFVYYRQKKIEDEDFLISKRNLGIFENLASINASKTGAILIAYTAMVYLYGLSAIWYFIGMSLGYLIFIPFGIKLYKLQKNKYYTLGDYFYKNYSKTLGNFTSFLCIFLMIGFLCINLVGSAKVLTLFTPLNYPLSVILIILIVFIYVIKSGFKSVVRTDFIQYLSIFLIILIFGIFILFNNFQFIKMVNFSLFDLDFKIFAPFIFILIQIVQVIVTPISHYIISIAGGYIFGLWQGFFLNLIGRVLGTILAFYLAKKFGRNFILKFVNKKNLKKFDNFFENQKYLLFLMYFLPLFPDDEISYLAGISKIKFKDFFIIVFFGHIGGSLSLSYIGCGIKSVREPLFLIIMFSTLILCSIYFIDFKKIKSKFVNYKNKLN